MTHGFRELCSGAHFTQHVQVIVAGTSIRAQRDDAGRCEFRHRAESARQFEIGFGTVHNVRT